MRGVHTMNLLEFFNEGYNMSSNEQKRYCKGIESQLLALPLKEQKRHCEVISKEIGRLRESIFEQSYDQMMLANNLADVMRSIKRDWPFEFELGQEVLTTLSRRTVKCKVIGFSKEPFRLVHVKPIDNVYKEEFGISESGLRPMPIEVEYENKTIDIVAALNWEYEQLSLF